MLEKCQYCEALGVMDLQIDESGIPLRRCQRCGGLHEDHSWYRLINDKEAEKIYETGKPIGLFVHRTEREFVGIDNSTGDVWTEEFLNIAECLRWLNREFEVGDDEFDEGLDCDGNCLGCERTCSERICKEK